MKKKAKRQRNGKKGMKSQLKRIGINKKKRKFREENQQRNKELRKTFRITEFTKLQQQ